MRIALIAVLVVALAACGGSKEATQSYEPGCTKLVVDVEAGTINGLKPTASMEKVKEQFPCFTGSSEEKEGMNCGGGVFFLEHDFYMYTGRDYLEVRYKYEGSVSEKLLSRGTHEVKADLGEPDKTVTDEEYEFWFYKKKYGSLVIQFRGGKSYLFNLYYSKPDDIELCY